MECENCGEEAEKGPFCNNCNIANLSLEVEKEKNRNRFLKKLIWFVIVIAIVAVAGVASYSII